MEMIKREMLSHQAVIAKTIESLQSHIYTASIITLKHLKMDIKFSYAVMVAVQRMLNI